MGSTHVWASTQTEQETTQTMLPSLCKYKVRGIIVLHIQYWVLVVFSFCFFCLFVFVFFSTVDIIFGRIVSKQSSGNILHHAWKISLVSCYVLSLIPPLQFHQRWRSQQLSRGLWWGTPPPSPALSAEASPWATTPTHGCTTTQSLSVKLVTCWLSISWQDLTLVSTAVRWKTLLDWMVVTLLPLSLEVSITNVWHYIS